MNQRQQEELIAHYKALLHDVVGGKRWIVGDGVLIGSLNKGKALIDMGAEAVLAIGGTRGTGTLPQADNLHSITLNLHAKDMMDGIRVVDEALKQPNAALLARIEAFDPAGTAAATGALWLTGADIAGRPLLGARSLQWQALEDKTTVDALWDRARITRAESEILPTNLAQLRRASSRMDTGQGAIWVGDNKEGWHGGASLVRWVRTTKQQEEAHAFLAAHCDTIRVMPFLDGIPCSIHAFVHKQEVAPIRPCEMLVYRRPNSAVFHYSGSATIWKPPQEQSQQMHMAAIRIGKHIQQEVGYQGSFTLDGVCTKEGFIPTEINPRYGGAIARMAGSLPGFPVQMIHNAMASGLDVDFRVAELAALIAHAADCNPIVRGMTMIHGRFDIEPETVFIRRKEDEWIVCNSESESEGTLNIGPSSTGSIVLANLHNHTVGRGNSAAPLLAKALMLASTYWALGLAPLLPAPDLR